MLDNICIGVYIITSDNCTYVTSSGYVIDIQNCQTPDLGQGLEFDFTLANNKNKNKKNKKNKNNNPHLNFPGWDGTRSLKFGTQT